MASSTPTRTPRTDSVGDYETGKDLILAFLAENAEKAYTKPEIHRGVDFGETDDPETIHEKLSSLPNTFVTPMDGPSRRGWAHRSRTRTVRRTPARWR